MIAGDFEVLRREMKTESIQRVLLRSLQSKHTRPWLDKLTMVAVIFFLTGMRPSQAQQPMDYAIQANIIYRFTKYIEWPESKKTGDFIIGIVGESPLTEQLQSFIINKTTERRKNCDQKILFVRRGI
jgi:hypothetical protein